MKLATHPRQLAAAALAERLERFCLRGIEERARGSCAEPGVSARAHARLGHDVGCVALGVPRRSIAFTLAMWDTIGVAPLLLEAVDEAISSIFEFAGASLAAELIERPVARWGPWNRDASTECLAYSIRHRITPRTQAPWVADAPIETPRPRLSRGRAAAAVGAA